MNKWNQAQADHRVAIVEVDDRWKIEGQHQHMWELLQKFLGQTLVLQVDHSMAHRLTRYTILHPDLPPVRWGNAVPIFPLVVDLAHFRTPTAYITEDHLLQVSL